jgi:penicillin-binding protein 2
MGRPLVANRSSWVVSVDRTCSARCPRTSRDDAARAARVVHVPVAKIEARILLCGQPGSVRHLLERLAVPAGARRARRPQKVAVKVLEQSEDYPGRAGAAGECARLPLAVRRQRAHLLGYLSPITEGELDEAEKDDDRSVNGASVVGRAGVEKAYDSGCVASPGYKKVAGGLDGPVLATRARSTRLRRHSGDLHRREGAGLRGEAAPRAMMTARGTFDKVTGRNYAAGERRGLVMEAQDRPHRRDGEPADVRPQGLVGGHHSEAAQAAVLRQERQPLLSRATQGQYAPGRPGSPFMTVGALNHGFSESTQLDCSSGVQVGNRLFKNYESAAFGYITSPRRSSSSCDTFFYRVGSLSGRSTAATPRT